MRFKALIRSGIISGPSRLMRRLVPACLRWRGRVVHWLPARRRPRLRTEMTHRSYRDGYAIERLSPPSAPVAPPPA
ncbi:MAG: hypothetical protein KY476_05575 [Planctomycetes bacterium]|nr:hypothetical protein [Planctomycetota bacterium]